MIQVSFDAKNSRHGFFRQLMYAVLCKSLNCLWFYLRVVPIKLSIRQRLIGPEKCKLTEIEHFDIVKNVKTSWLWNWSRIFGAIWDPCNQWLRRVYFGPEQCQACLMSNRKQSMIFIRTNYPEARNEKWRTLFSSDVFVVTCKRTERRKAQQIGDDVIAKVRAGSTVMGIEPGCQVTLSLRHWHVLGLLPARKSFILTDPWIESHC